MIIIILIIILVTIIVIVKNAIYKLTLIQFCLSLVTITDWIGLHSVLLPLLININSNTINNNDSDGEDDYDNHDDDNWTINNNNYHKYKGAQSGTKRRGGKKT